MATLSETEVHLHLARPDTLVDPARLARWRDLLDDDERARCDRFRHAHLRHMALITRVLVRTTLSRYADVAPERWRFAKGAHGRPSIAGDDHGLHFNVAHTEGLVVCAVARRASLGVDVEHLTMRAEPVTVAEHFFAEAEVRALRGLEGDALHERFLAIWTLKEAYAKARGLGLNLPLDQYAFTFDADDRASLWVDERVRDDDHPWQLERRAIGAHRLAVALRLSPGEAPAAISLRDALLSADFP